MTGGGGRWERSFAGKGSAGERKVMNQVDFEKRYNCLNKNYASKPGRERETN